jgi:hypothetical protein
LLAGRTIARKELTTDTAPVRVEQDLDVVDPTRSIPWLISHANTLANSSRKDSKIRGHRKRRPASTVVFRDGNSSEIAASPAANFSLGRLG